MHLIGLKSNSHNNKDLKLILQEIQGLSLNELSNEELFDNIKTDEIPILFIPFRSAELDFSDIAKKVKRDSPRAIIIAMIDEKNENLEIIEECLNAGADDVIDPKTTTKLALQKIISFNQDKRVKEQELEVAQKQIAWNTKRLALSNDIHNYVAKTEQDYLDYALNKALELAESTFGYIYFYDEDRKLFTLNSWSDNVMENCGIVEPNTCYELDKTGYWGEAVRQRKPLILNDFQKKNPLKKGYPEGHAELYRFMTTPVFNDDKIIAVVGMANKKEPYTEDDVQQLQFMMNSVWSTLSNRKTNLENLEIAHALENSPVSIVITDLDGNIELVNKYFEKRTGYSFQEVKGKNPRVLKSGAQSEAYYKNLWQTIKSGKTWSGELQNKAKDGSIYWESSTISPIKNPNGIVTKFIAVKKDITEKRLQDLELIRKNRVLEAVESISSTGGWEYDVKTEKVEWTKAMYDLHGFDKNEGTVNLIEKSLKCYNGADKKRIGGLFTNAIKKGEGFEGIFSFTSLKDEKLWVRHKCEAIKDSDGSVLNVYGSMRDVTNEINSKVTLEDYATKLKESEQIKSSVIDVLAEGLVVQDQSDQIVLANEAAAKILGLSMDQLKGKTSFDPLWSAADDRGKELDPSDHPSMVTLKTGESVFNFIMKVNTGKNERKIIRVNSNPIKDKKDKILQAVTSFTDITDFELANDKIKEAETRLEFAVTATQAGTWDWNIATDVVLINKRWAGMLGYEPSELEVVNLKVWQNLCHPNDLEHALHVLGLHIKNQSDYFDAQVRMKHKLGHWVWVWTRGQVFSRDDSGKALRMVGTHVDITASKKIEFALKESEEKYRFLTEAIGELIWSASPDGHIDYVNQYGLDILGTSLTELSNTGWLSIVHPEDKEQVIQKWTAAVESATDYFNEQRFLTRDGSYRWFKVTATARKDSKGKTVKWVGLTIDINSEKVAADEIKKNAHNLTLLSGFANDFIHFTDKESIYSYLADQVQKMVGSDSIVILSELKEKSSRFEIKKSTGLANKTKQILDFIGQPVVGITGNINPNVHLRLNTDTLTDLPLSISAITDGAFASKINDGVFKLLGITGIKSILLKLDDQEIGILSIIVRKEQLDLNEDLLRAFLKQASLALLRAQTVDEVFMSEKALKEAQSIAKLGSFSYYIENEAYELSDEAKNLLGIKSASTLTQDDMLASVFPEDKPLVEKQYSSMKEGNYSEFVYRVSVNNKTKWLRQIARPRLDTNARIIALESTILDVTNQKEIEQKLEQSKTRFKNLIEHNSDLIFLENKNFKLSYISPSVQAMLGYSADELLNQSGRALIHPDDLKKRDEAFQKIIDKPQSVVKVKLRLEKKNRTYIWTEIAYSNQLDVPGIEGFILNIRDIDNDERSAYEIKVANERFKLAGAATKSIIWDFDVEKREYFINDSFKSLFGYKDQYISAKRWNELIHEEDRLRVQKSFDQLTANTNQSFWLIDFRFKKLDGSYAWTSNKSTIIRNSLGEIVRVIGTIDDITERVQFEQFIQKQNEQLKDIAWMQSHIVRAPLTNLLSLIELLKDSDPEERIEMERMLYESANKLDSVIKNIVKNAERLGKTPNAIINQSSAKNESSVSDIHLHPSLLEMSPKAYVVCNKKKQIIFTNNAFEELSGFELSYIYNDNFFTRLFAIEENEDDVNYLIKKEAKREPYEVELKLETRSEQPIWVRLHGQPYISESGVFQGYFFTLKNIEAEKSAEKIILEKSESLTHINDELKHFTYTISHDLKEPVNSLSGILSLLKIEGRDSFTEAEQEYLGMATESVSRISAMVKSLLEYSRFGSDQEEAQTIRIKTVLHQIKLALRVQIERNKASVNFHGNNEEIMVHPIQFSRVLQNLINNSIKFRSEKNPIVDVRLSDTGTHWKIEVEDNGKGINKGDLKHVFDLFYFKNQNKNDSHGVGLAVVKKLVEKHNGEISVESKEGKGTTFTFTIAKSLN